MHLNVRVVPNAKKFSVSFKDGIWKIHVPAKAEDNKANLELVAALSEAMGTRVSLVGGAKSRSKVLDISGDEEAVLAKLRKIAEK